MRRFRNQPVRSEEGGLVRGEPKEVSPDESQGRGPGRAERGSDGVEHDGRGASEPGSGLLIAGWGELKLDRFCAAGDLER